MVIEDGEKERREQKERQFKRDLAVKLVLEKGPRVLDGLRSGLSIDDAARVAGVEEASIVDWIKRATDQETPFVGFQRQMDDARREDASKKALRPIDEWLSIVRSEPTDDKAEARKRAAASAAKAHAAVRFLCEVEEALDPTRPAFPDLHPFAVALREFDVGATVESRWQETSSQEPADLLFELCSAVGPSWNSARYEQPLLSLMIAESQKRTAPRANLRVRANDNEITRALLVDLARIRVKAVIP